MTDISMNHRTLSSPLLSSPLPLGLSRDGNLSLYNEGEKVNLQRNTTRGSQNNLFTTDLHNPRLMRSFVVNY